MLSKAEQRCIKTLEDIRKNILMAQQFIAGIEVKAFLQNNEKIYAVIRSLEIISEASRRLPQSVRELYPQILWRQIAAAGNVYRHEYERLQDLEIWRTVQEGLPPLLAVVEVELKSRAQK